MNEEELLYNSGRPRRTRSSLANITTPASTSNPYKRPTYSVGRRNDSPDDSPEEVIIETPPTAVRGRRKPGRPFGSTTKNRTNPSSAPASPSPARNSRGRGRGRGGNVGSRNETAGSRNGTAGSRNGTAGSRYGTSGSRNGTTGSRNGNAGSRNNGNTSASTRKRSSTVSRPDWNGKFQPECLASRNERGSIGSRRKKARRGYSTADYHYGSDFESDELDSDRDNNESESDSIIDRDSVEDDMPLDEPIESDSDLSIGSARASTLPSIPCPVWLDDEVKIEKLEIPRSSDDLLLGRELLIDAVAIYEPLRRFSSLVRLSPFRFEDFCAALVSEEISFLLAEIHIQLLKALIREDDNNTTTFGANECKDSVQSIVFFIENMTWAECLRAYVESERGWAEIHDLLLSVDYPFCGPEKRLKILTWLLDVFIVSSGVRDTLMNEGKIVHEDYCRHCNRLGELICCETCPAVFHLDCIALSNADEDPPDDWKCPVCEKHKLAGVTDCLSEIEKAGVLTRQEKLGYDRHGRKYWFLARRVFVESEDKSEVWYYSTRLQLEELLYRLDGQKFEKELVENINNLKEEMFRQMGVTEAVTSKMNVNHRKTYLDAENAFLKRIHQEREVIKEEETSEKLKIEEQVREAKKKELEEKHRLEEEERSRKEEEKRRIRDERLAKRNQLKLKQRLESTIPDLDQDLEQILLNEESKDSFTTELVKTEPFETVDDGAPILENGTSIKDETEFSEAETQKIMPELKIEISPIRKPPESQESKDTSIVDDDTSMELEEPESKAEIHEEKLETVKLEQMDIEPLVKTSILPKIHAKSLSLSLEVDSEERMTRLRSIGLYKLGQEGSFKNYINCYSTDVLALSKNQHTEDRDKRRVMSHKFSLTSASECKWVGVQQGQRLSIVATIRQTLLNMEVAIPITLMHCNWNQLRKEWIACVTCCSTASDFSKVLTMFASCLRPSVFNPVWSEGVGHVKLLRTTAIARDIRKKNEQVFKKFKDDEEDRFKLLPQYVKYTIPPKHQVWKQKGEEFRLHGTYGWIWLSNFRRIKEKDSKTMGLQRGPHKHVIQVKGNSGKVKTMLIDPDAYTKLMARRATSLEQKKSDVGDSTSLTPLKTEVKQESIDACLEAEVRAVLESLLGDVVEGKEIPTSPSQEHKPEMPEIEKSEPLLNSETDTKPQIQPSTPTRLLDIKSEKDTPAPQPHRKFRTDVINVSLGIVSANRILYPKIAHEVKFLDSLLERRIMLQEKEEKDLVEEYGEDIIESLKGPPPVLDESPIEIKVDTAFPLHGGYNLTCYSYECHKADMEGCTNFESKCLSPMCRLKAVIRDTRRRKAEKERIMKFEKAKKARLDIIQKRQYNQSSTNEKVYLKKFPEVLKKDEIKYPSCSKFRYHASKSPSILILPRYELTKLARTAGRSLVPMGFLPNHRPNASLWPYPCGRPFFKTTWLWRTVHLGGIYAAALQLRILYASVRWDDIGMKPLNMEGKSLITTDMELITSEILNHRIIGRFQETYQYLRRRHIVPIDAPKTVREVVPSRSGLRKRKRAESPDNALPVVREEWVEEDKFEVWEIKLYGERLERKLEKKPEPPSSATRTKTGVALKVPEKYDPSPKDREKIDIQQPIPSPTQLPQVITPVKAPVPVHTVPQPTTYRRASEVDDSKFKGQRFVHLSKRDNHAKIVDSPNKPPTLTASQQVLQQQSAAAAAGTASALVATKAITITQATSPSGRKFFVTKPNVQAVPKPSPLATPVKETAIKSGILKKAIVGSPAVNLPVVAPSVGSQILPAPAMINSPVSSTPSPANSNTTGATTQKFQVVRMPDGKIQVRGLMPGQTAFTGADGRLHVFSAPTNATLEDKTMIGEAQVVSSAVGVQPQPPIQTPSPLQPLVNISNPALRPIIKTSPPSTVTTRIIRPSMIRKPAIVRQPIPPQILTVNRTAEDLKLSPLHLQTSQGIIEVRAHNVTKSATGQDQIILGPNMPIIQLLPPKVPEPSAEPLVSPQVTASTLHAFHQQHALHSTVPDASLSATVPTASTAPALTRFVISSSIPTPIMAPPSNTTIPTSIITPSTFENPTAIMAPATDSTISTGVMASQVVMTSQTITTPPMYETTTPILAMPIQVATTPSSVMSTPTLSSPIRMTVPTVPQQLGIPTPVTAATIASLGQGGKIIYTDGNNQFVLNTTGYSDTQIESIIHQLQQKKIVVKYPEVAVSETMNVIQSPQQLIQQQMLLQQPLIHAQPQQIIIRSGNKLLLQGHTALGIAPSVSQNQRTIVPQFATIGGQRVVINRGPGGISQMRIVNPGSIQPASVMSQNIVQTTLPKTVTSAPVTFSSPAKTIIAVTPSPSQQSRPILLRQSTPVITSVPATVQQLTRTPLPISIVSPTKPRIVHSQTPIRYRSDITSPYENEAPLWHQEQPGVRVQSPINVSPLARKSCPPIQDMTKVQPIVTHNPIPAPRISSPIRQEVPPTPPATESLTKSQGKVKLVAQISNTDIGPRLIIQGLPSKLTQTQLLVLESQLSTQLTASGYRTDIPLVDGISNHPEGGIPLFPIDSLQTQSPSHEDELMDSGLYTKAGQPSILTKRNTRLPSKAKQTSPNQAVATMEDLKSIDESIEAAIGAVMQSGTTVTPSTGIHHNSQSSHVVSTQSRTVGIKRPPVGDPHRSHQPSSAKKRKTSGMLYANRGDESPVIDPAVPQQTLISPTHEFPTPALDDSEANFVLSQDLVGQAGSQQPPQEESQSLIPHLSESDHHLDNIGGNEEIPSEGNSGLVSSTVSTTMIPLVQSHTSSESIVLQQYISSEGVVSTTNVPQQPVIKMSRRKSPIRMEPSPKTLAMNAQKLMMVLQRQKELLKKDICKRRALQEKELTIDVQAEVAEEMARRNESMALHESRVENLDVKITKKRKSCDSSTPTLKTSKGRPSLPSPGLKSVRRLKGKKKRGNGIVGDEDELHCICQTTYDKNKFYVGCDKCLKWYHGECVGITEELAKCISDYICDSCQNPKKQLYCICRQEYDETQFYIACDKCDDWLHGHCVGLLPSEGGKIDQYLCPTCDPNTPLNHANLKRLTPGDFIHLEKLLRQILANKASAPFREPVDSKEAPNYYRVIKEPMDLQIIVQRVDQKIYERLRDFIGDITKIIDNCRYFNRPESKVVKSANLLETFLGQKFKALRQQLAE